MYEFDKVRFDKAYDAIDEKMRGTLDHLLTSSDITGEQVADVISKSITTVVDRSLTALKDSVDIEIAKQTGKFVIKSAYLDSEIKEQEAYKHELENGRISFEYVFYKSYYDKEGNKVDTEETTGTDIAVGEDTFILFNDYSRLKNRTLTDSSEAPSTVELQQQKLQKEIEYQQTQTMELVKSVVYNNKIQSAGSLSKVFGDLGLGGVVVPETGWQVFFDLIQELASTTIEDVNGFADAVEPTPTE